MQCSASVLPSLITMKWQDFARKIIEVSFVSDILTFLVVVSDILTLKCSLQNKALACYSSEAKQAGYLLNYLLLKFPNFESTKHQSGALIS